MAKYDISDTIAAIATPVGESGIGIIRISGKEALPIADKIFLSKDGDKPSEFKTYTTHYGWIVNGHQSPVTSHQLNNPGKRPATGDRKAEIIDEVILTVMRAPKSYTKEDIVEINCHGGIVAMRRILDLVLENGCRLAEPGEFTKRAFLNGRIDLAQAEAVLDIIRAKTDSSLKMSAEQLRGLLSQRINKFRRTLLDILARLEANINFPEEEIDAANLKVVSKEFLKINNELKDILSTANTGRALREGIHTVICGRPNVGKSSLLNALLKQERSIVTSIAGTTRDTIEETIDIKGIPIKIVDTAGIIEPKDLVEKKALERTKRQMDLADLIILIFDASKKLSPDDLILIKKIKKRRALAVINKIDLRQKIEKEKIAKAFGHLLEISAKKLQNIGLLEEKIADLVYNGKIRNRESFSVSNLRHITALRHAQKHIAEAAQSLDNKLSLEFIAEDLKEALSSLDEILGRRFSEDLLDKIFNEFCIGK